MYILSLLRNINSKRTSNQMKRTVLKEELFLLKAVSLVMYVILEILDTSVCV